MVPEPVAELRRKNYNATVAWLRKVHSDLAVSRSKPDFPVPAHKPGQYTSLGLGYWEPRLPGCQEEELKPDDAAKLARRAYSIGCSVLFLNWLRFQLGFTWEQVIAAGAPTLAEVYQNLTGRSDALSRFKAQLEANFPSGTPSGLTTDQPYPLPGLPT